MEEGYRLVKVPEVKSFRFFRGKIYFEYPYNRDFIKEIREFKYYRWGSGCWQVVLLENEILKLKNFIKKWYNVEVRITEIQKHIKEVIK